MGQHTAMSGLVPGLGLAADAGGQARLGGLADPGAARLASLVDPKQAKNKNNRNGYRAKELAEIRNSLRPFEQGDQIATAATRNSLRQVNGGDSIIPAVARQPLTNDQLRQLNGVGDGLSPPRLSSQPQQNGETKLRLNGEHLRQLNGELQQLEAEQQQQLRSYDADQLRTVSSLSDGSSSEGVIPAQQTLKETLNKLALMGYDEVGWASSATSVSATVSKRCLKMRTIIYVCHTDLRRDLGNYICRKREERGWS